MGRTRAIIENIAVALSCVCLACASADGLWVKELTWSQQPTVHYKHIGMLAVEGAEAGKRAQACRANSPASTAVVHSS